MKMIRYIASDLDGTLLPKGTLRPDPEIFDLILRLKKAGIRFIAASGRQYQNMRRLLKPVRDGISYIAENGSLCVHDGQVIYRGTIGRELGLRIIAAGRAYGDCHTLLSCESTHYTDSRDPRFIHIMRDVIRNEIRVVDDLCQVEEPFLKLAICDFKGTARLAPFLEERFSGEIRTATSADNWVDFIAPDAGKGLALGKLLEHLGLGLRDGIAFGDQYNDIDMLEMAGVGYAMKTAAPGVSDHADRITDSVTDVLKEVLSSL